MEGQEGADREDRENAVSQNQRKMNAADAEDTFADQGVSMFATNRFIGLLLATD
jgi:hypothetical protein